MHCPNGCQPSAVRQLNTLERQLVEVKVGPAPDDLPIEGLYWCETCGLVFSETEYEKLPVLIRVGHLSVVDGKRQFQKTKSD